MISKLSKERKKGIRIKIGEINTNEIPISLYSIFEKGILRTPRIIKIGNPAFVHFGIIDENPLKMIKEVLFKERNWTSFNKNTLHKTFQFLPKLLWFKIFRAFLPYPNDSTAHIILDFQKTFNEDNFIDTDLNNRGIVSWKIVNQDLHRIKEFIPVYYQILENIGLKFTKNSYNEEEII